MYYEIPVIIMTTAKNGLVEYYGTPITDSKPLHNKIWITTQSISNEKYYIIKQPGIVNSRNIPFYGLIHKEGDLSTKKTELPRRFNIELGKYVRGKHSFENFILNYDFKNKLQVKIRKIKIIETKLTDKSSSKDTKDSKDRIKKPIKLGKKITLRR